ncbi:UTRA domain-containing protein, partial [Polymorphobacter sp.]|uniref:UTRA domain-containing protein n=1 Tax=Polymorphobacter sp. TaxID=1909290 RepID=UPI003F724DC4
YVPERCAEIGERIGKDGTPVYRLMENMFGLVAADIDAELFAGTLPAPKAKPLGVEPGSATLVIVRRYHDRDGQLFEVSVSEHPASRFSYSVALKRRAPEG